MSNEARAAVVKVIIATFRGIPPANYLLQETAEYIADAAIAAFEAAKPAGEVVATVDEVVAGTQPYENSLGVDELRREVRMLWDEKAAFRKAILTAPEVPEVAVLWHLEGAAMNYHGADLFDIGKRLQRAHPRTIPYKTELEHAAGLWSILREGLVSGLTPQASVDSAALAASPVPSEPSNIVGGQLLSRFPVLARRLEAIYNGAPKTTEMLEAAQALDGAFDRIVTALTRPEPAQDAGVKL